MMDIIEKLKIKHPWRDEAFWLAVFATLSLLAPRILEKQFPQVEDFTPLGLYLVHNGYLRGRSVVASGVAIAEAPEGMLAAVQPQRRSILPTLWALRVRPADADQGDPWKRVRTWKNPLGLWRSRANATWVLDNKLKPKGWVGHAFPVENPNAQPRVDDWLFGNIVPIADVPSHHREAYRKMLYAAARAAKRVGRPLEASSSYRFGWEQQALYDAYLAGKGPLAAPPGSSDHERGIALDLPDHTGAPGVRDDAEVRAAVEAEGFVFDVPSEGWHVKYTRA